MNTATLILSPAAVPISTKLGCSSGGGGGGGAGGAATVARTMTGAGGCREGVNNGRLTVAVRAVSGIAQSGLALSVEDVCGLAETSGGSVAGRAISGTELSDSGPSAATVPEGVAAIPGVASQSATTKVRVNHMCLIAQPAHSPGAATGRANGPNRRF